MLLQFVLPGSHEFLFGVNPVDHVEIIFSRIQVVEFARFDDREVDGSSARASARMRAIPSLSTDDMTSE